jgi:hypothetical protein
MQKGSQKDSYRLGGRMNHERPTQPPEESHEDLLDENELHSDEPEFASWQEAYADAVGVSSWRPL